MKKEAQRLYALRFTYHYRKEQISMWPDPRVKDRIHKRDVPSAYTRKIKKVISADIMLGSVLDPWEIIGDFKSVYNAGLKAPKFLENKMIKKGLVYRKLEGVKQNELTLFLKGKHPDEFVYREITRVELYDGTKARYLSEYYGPESFFEGEPELLTPEDKVVLLEAYVRESFRLIYDQ
ncbi:hypothetical protein E3N88_22971 [Mikania micrantha]|uniref:Uncharacterized protein n=1 Tax=Mikania micrantha TaxID=192012 RepID=A0A5N6NDQ1_9ASTR|nr:hypothetical protein E3N88_22971 [Mikania micrantha]